MRKNNGIKSRRRNGAIARSGRRTKKLGLSNNKSKRSNASPRVKGANKTLETSSDIPMTSRRNTTWMKRLEKFPDMGRQFDDAIQLYRSGKLHEAARLLERTVVEFPDQSPILWYLGGIYRDLKEPERAIPHCRRATELTPRSEHASLGLFHALWDADQLDEALEEIKRFQVLTNWSCEDYLEIMDEIDEKWVDEPPVNGKKKSKR